MNKIEKSNLNKRSFTWGIKSSDVQLEPPGQVENRKDAAAGCGNCSEISALPASRKPVAKRPVRD